MRLPDGFDYERLYGAAYGLAYRLLASRMAAEDVAAEAIARLFTRRSELAEHPRIEAWVLRVASNLSTWRVQ